MIKIDTKAHPSKKPLKRGYMSIARSLNFTIKQPIHHSTKPPQVHIQSHLGPHLYATSHRFFSQISPPSPFSHFFHAISYASSRSLTHLVVSNSGLVQRASYNMRRN
jgi:hypothetical protein